MVRGRSLGQAIGVVALVCATFGVSTASAQVDYEIMASLQFNFSNPGARSLAMAGALTGAGDDATGAWTNPGGLTNITRPEVGVEFRGFDFETPFVSSGRFNGTPTNIGIDTVNGLTYGNTDNSTHSLSFVSAVVPKSRFAFAFYRTEVANFEADIQTVGPFYDWRPVRPAPRRDPIAASASSRSNGNLDLQISNFGGSAAVRLTDQVSVGVGVSFYDFEIEFGEPPFRPDRRARRPTPAASTAPPSYALDATSSPPSSSAGRTRPSASTSARRSTRTTSSASAPATARGRSSTSPTTARTSHGTLMATRNASEFRCPTSSPSACWSSRSTR